MVFPTEGGFIGWLLVKPIYKKRKDFQAMADYVEKEDFREFKGECAARHSKVGDDISEMKECLVRMDERQSRIFSSLENGDDSFAKMRDDLSKQEDGVAEVVGGLEIVINGQSERITVIEKKFARISGGIAVVIFVATILANIVIAFVPDILKKLIGG